MTKSHSGGGRTPVRAPVRTGPTTTKAISPEAVANIGIKKGNHVTGQSAPTRSALPPLVQSTPQQPVRYGNDIAKDVGRGSPGAGRTVHSTGGQGQHGAAVQGAQPQGRDILSEFGPESGPRREP